MRRLQSVALAAVAVIGFASIASAADMPTKAPYVKAPIVAPWNWAGFYAGAEIGAAWVHDALTETTTVFVPSLTGSATSNNTAFVGGGYFGYNWQMGSWVFGPEIDFEGTSLNNSNSCLIQDAGVGNPAPGACFTAPTAPNTYSFSTQLPWQASIRGRIGYAWNNNALLYVTGGVAFAEIKTNYTTISGAAPLGSQSFDQTRAGGTVGGGVEYAFNRNWIGRIEYRFTDFGTVSNTITSAGNFWNGYTDSHRLQENTARVGLSYLFH